MPTESLRLGVIATLRPPVTRWGTATLRPTAVLPAAPATAPGALIAETAGVRTFYLGDGGLTLHSGDTGHYRDNLSSARPSIWVALSGAEDAAHAAIHLVTADPYEGEGLAGDPALTVEAVPLPDPVRAAIERFVAIHHTEIAFIKRKRAPVDPDARAPRVLRPEDKWGRR